MISHYVKDMLGLKPLLYCSNFSGAGPAVQVAKKRNFYLQKRSYLFRLWKLLLCVDNADFCFTTVLLSSQNYFVLLGRNYRIVSERCLLKRRQKWERLLLSLNKCSKIFLSFSTPPGFFCIFCVYCVLKNGNVLSSTEWSFRCVSGGLSTVF